MTAREAAIALQAMTSLELCPADRRDALRAEMMRKVIMLLMME